MPYFPSLNEYLHQSSLLIQAYPDTRITTRYSLPRKPRPGSKSKPPLRENTTATDTDTAPPTTQHQQKKEPSATLTLKTYHPGSGICLKYRTDKAAEVGRLVTGLGRLAKGEMIEMPAIAAAGAVPGTTTEGGDKMDVDSAPAAGESGLKVEDKVAAGTSASQQTQQSSGGGGGGKKKKKGKK